MPRKPTAKAQTREDLMAFEEAMADVTPLVPRAGSRLPGKAPPKGPADPNAGDRRPIDKGTLRATEQALAQTRAALHAARVELDSLREERDEWIHRARSTEGMRATLKVEMDEVLATQPATVPLVGLLAKDTGADEPELWAERVLELLMSDERDALLASLRITAEGFERWRSALLAQPAEG